MRNPMRYVWGRISGAANDATVTYRVHACLAGMWIALVIPTWYLWRTSLFWVAFISLYANFVSHWGAWQAVRAEIVAGRAEEVAGGAREKAVEVAAALEVQSMKEFRCAAEQMKRIEDGVDRIESEIEGEE
jgi:hypothetical protein